MFMFSLSAFKHLLNPVSVLFTWEPLFQESAATSPPSLSSRRLFAALQKCQQLRVDLVLQGRAHAVGPAWNDLERGSFTSFADKSAESAIGTIWSSSP